MEINKNYSINMKLVDGIFMNLNFDNIIKDGSMLFFYKNDTLIFSSDTELIEHKLKLDRINDLGSVIFKDYKLNYLSK